MQSSEFTPLTPADESRFARIRRVYCTRRNIFGGLLVGLSVMLVVGLVATVGTNAPPAPSFIILNATIWTGDYTQPWATHLAVLDDHITAVGNKEVAALAAESTVLIQGNGRLVLPGFVDTHVHPAAGGVELLDCDLHSVHSVPALLARVRAFAAEHPDKPWILGSGWELTLFPNANPDKSLLDNIVEAKGRPIFLVAADGHSAWASSAALAISNVTRFTPDPPNGLIERNSTGYPSGTLREEAIDLVSAYVPPYSRADWLAGAQAAVQLANSLGVTSMMDASVRDAELQSYVDAAGTQRGLTVRMTGCLFADPSLGAGSEQLDRLNRLRSTYARPFLRTNCVKIFADGVLESQTASVLLPYVNTTNYGIPNWTPAELKQLITQLDQQNFQVHVHAIGDRAIRDSLDAFEAAIATNGRRDSRHMIAHLELIDPADIPRFALLGVTASFQPFWAFADEYIVSMTEPLLGPERSKWLYPIRSVMVTGATVSGGSDWTVSTMDPLLAIQVAVTRTDPNANSSDASAALRAAESRSQTVGSAAGSGLRLRRQQHRHHSLASPAERYSFHGASLRAQQREQQQLMQSLSSPPQQRPLSSNVDFGRGAAPGDDPEDPWLPEQIVDLVSMLRSYTANGAFATFTEQQGCGVLSVGAKADLVMLSRNVLAGSPQEVAAARVALTMFNGQRVYQA